MISINLQVTKQYGQIISGNISDLSNVISYISSNFNNSDIIPTAMLTKTNRNINYTDGYDPNITGNFQKYPLLIKNMCFFIENVKSCFYSGNNSSIQIDPNPNNDIFIIVHENIKEFPSTYYQSFPTDNFRNFLKNCTWHGDTDVQKPYYWDTVGCIITSYTNPYSSGLLDTNIFEVEKAR